MTNIEMNPKFIFVVGPTAAGKSAWAIENAKKFDGSIVNIDSVQFYEGLEVGAASPSEEEKSSVPHFLYSYVRAPEEMTAGRYIRDFYQLIESGKVNLQKPIFIVGGTGFYIQALEKGMYDVEPIPEAFRADMEQELVEKGAEELHRELLLKDPNSKIHVNDHYRLVRALEIIRYFGKTPTELQMQSDSNKNKFKYPFLKIGIDMPPEMLRDRVVRRTEQMVSEGIIEETKAILEQGFQSWAPLNSVGYKETMSYLQEHQNKALLRDEIVQSTMKLIKKQRTWFKRDSAILWSNQNQALAHFLS